MAGIRLHQRMTANATSGALAAPMPKTNSEVQDFDNVVLLFWPRIHRFLLASLRDSDAAETLTQECFLRAFRARHRFRGDSSVHTWLMRIAINLARDFARNRRLQFWRWTRVSGLDTHDISEWIPDSSASPEARTLQKERITAIWRATKTLSERQRTVFILRFVEDMDVLEIADATGLSEGSVKVHLFRALQTVRRRIGKTHA